MVGNLARPIESLMLIEVNNPLELVAVQQVLFMTNLTKTPVNNYYYCGDYSVLHYKLVNKIIGNLKGQTERSNSADIIATSYPQVAVESLCITLTLTLLEMVALNLKPIKFHQIPCSPLCEDYTPP